MHLLLSLSFLLAPALLAAEPSLVSATLSQRRRLHLVELVSADEEHGELGLRGSLRVELRNDSAEPVDLLNWDVMGLRFRDTSSGVEHFVVHPCACWFVAGFEPAPFESRVHVGAGERATIEISDWGCGGGLWDPPPQGTYELTFRLSKGPPEPLAGPRELRRVLRSCEPRIRGEIFGEDSIVTPPVTITLKRPKRVVVR